MTFFFVISPRLFYLWVFLQVKGSTAHKTVALAFYPPQGYAAVARATKMWGSLGLPLTGPFSWHFFHLLQIPVWQEWDGIHHCPLMSDHHHTSDQTEAPWRRVLWGHEGRACFCAPSVWVLRHWSHMDAGIIHSLTPFLPLNRTKASSTQRNPVPEQASGHDERRYRTQSRSQNQHTNNVSVIPKVLCPEGHNRAWWLKSWAQRVISRVPF